MTNQKMGWLQRGLEQGVTRILVVTNRLGVVLPTEFRKVMFTPINLSFRFEPCDLKITDWGVSVTLSFSKKPYFCKIPWGAIFGVECKNGDSCMWREDAPTAQDRPRAYKPQFLN